MADFSYEGTGGLRIRGCADDFSIEKVWITEFSVGSIVYPKKLAESGILTKVAIKKVTIDEIFGSYGGSVANIFYTDNFNSRYIEGDVVSLSAGLLLSDAYDARVIASDIANKRKNGCY